MRRRSGTLALLVLTIAIGACGLAPLSPTVPKSTFPVTPGHPTAHPVLGVDIYANYGLKLAQTVTDGTRVLKAVKQTLGVNAIGIVWNFWMKSDHSNSVMSTDGTLTVNDVETLTRLALADGLAVEYRPLIKVEGPNPWSGGVNPTDETAWANSLYSVELPYLQAAQRLGVKEFVIATEMATIGSDALWGPLVSEVQKVAPDVAISYASSAKDYFKALATLTPPHLLSRINVYGVDAYMAMPKSISDSSTVADLVDKGWDPVFASVPRNVLEATAIDEIGIPAETGAYQRPARWFVVTAPDPQVQANWITAACDVVEQYHMRGLFFFNVNLTDNPKSWPKSAVTFMGKPLSERAIRGCLRTFNET
jgi:hypothetical protein